MVGIALITLGVGMALTFIICNLISRAHHRSLRRRCLMRLDAFSCERIK